MRASEHRRAFLRRQWGWRRAAWVRFPHLAVHRSMGGDDTGEEASSAMMQRGSEQERPELGSTINDREDALPEAVTCF